MSFRNGMARLTIVVVVIVELILLGNTYRAWTELSETRQRLAELPFPPPAAGVDEHPCLDPSTPCDPVELIRSGAEDSARREYDYTAATIETKKTELYLLLGSLLLFPLIVAVVFQTLFWVGRGFRNQPA
jgi:hypothetical protein